MDELQSEYELNRKTLDELMFYDGKSKDLDLKNLECLTLIAPVNKNQLLEYLLKSGWIPRISNGIGSNYNLYTLQKPRPIEWAILCASARPKNGMTTFRLD